MSYAVLTSESNVARALKPGGFDEHKHMAYAVAAYRIPEVREKYPTSGKIFVNNLPDEDSLQIINEDELNLLKSLQDRAEKLVGQVKSDPRE